MNKLIQIYNKLLKEFGQQGWWPIHGKYDSKFNSGKRTTSEKFEICVGAVLTKYGFIKKSDIHQKFFASMF